MFNMSKNETPYCSFLFFSQEYTNILLMRLILYNFSFTSKHRCKTETLRYLISCLNISPADTINLNPAQYITGICQLILSIWLCGNRSLITVTSSILGNSMMVLYFVFIKCAVNILTKLSCYHRLTNTGNWLVSCL